MKKIRKLNVLSIIIILIFITLAAGSTDEDSSSSSDTISLNAKVSFDGSQFIITNQDSNDWKDVELQINPKILTSGYTYNTSIMKSGSTYTVGAMNFSNSDGKRFNPFEYKPQEIWISATINGEDGFYSGAWK